MKNLNLSKYIFFFLFIGLIISCKKNNINITGVISGPSTVCYVDQGIEYSIVPSSETDYILWTVPEQAEIISGQGTKEIKVNFGRKAGNICVKFYKDNQEITVPCFEVKFDSTGKWCRELNFGGGFRAYSFGFSIGNKGYVGMGLTNTAIKPVDFWEFDPAEKVWTQKKDFNGPHRVAAVSFAIGTKGYVGTGQVSNATGQDDIFNDFYEYDPITNQWLRKQDFIGAKRQYAFGFSIGNKGYIGGGLPGILGTTRDFYEYDPANGQWVKKDSFPVFRNGAASFSIGNKGYVGTGGNGSVYYKDFYEFDPTDSSKGFDTNNNPLGKWTEKAPFPGDDRAFGIGFSLEGYGYMGFGLKGSNLYFNDFWKYSPDSGLGQWEQIPSFAQARAYPIGFSIANKGYVGTGNNGLATTNFFKDFWVFTQ